MKIVAIDIGGTSIKSGQIIDGKLSSYNEYDTNAKRGGAYVMDRICEIIGEYQNFDRIGISTAGQVDPVEGYIRFANESIPGYTGMRVKDILEGRFNVPVSVDNDVNCAAIGEAHYGAGKEYDNFICLTYGTGIGGAIVINRQLYRGSIFSAGEFGHIVTHAGGLECSCGLRGCYEQYASTTALVKKVMNLDPSFTSGREIFKHIDNIKVQEIVNKWIDEIIIGLASLTHIFNPECIILGGGIMNVPYIIERLNALFYENIMPSFNNVVLKQAQLGNKSGLFGAAHLAAE